MPSISSRIKVKFKQDEPTGKRRNVSLQGEIPEKLLEIPELLAKNGVIPSLEVRLRENFRETVLAHVREAEEALDRVKGEPEKRNENGQVAPLRAVEG